MPFIDDDLVLFEAHGAPLLPKADCEGFIENAGARIWYASYGSGPAVVLLHGGLGHAGNWGHQVPALVEAGRRVLVLDSRGHGRSTRDEQVFSYELMAADVVAVMKQLAVETAALVGWSDGACSALALAKDLPERAVGVLFFACNVDGSGTKPFEATPVIDRCFARHKQDFSDLSSSPGQFDAFMKALMLMQRTQPEYSARDLAAIPVPVTVVYAERDEFIKREHAEYLARCLPRGEFVLLPGVTHFAPLQRPDQFNAAILNFLEGLDA